jgi:hypothetical protein
MHMTNAVLPVLSGREKVLRAIARMGPAPFPRHLRPCPALADHFRALAGADDLDALFGLDLRWIHCGRPAGFEFDAERFNASWAAECAGAVEGGGER